MEILLDINWDNFNSCVLIESENESSQDWAAGVAIDRETIITTTDLLNNPIFKIFIHTLNSQRIEAESFELHPNLDLIKIKLKSPLPLQTTIYPLLKDHRKITGNLIQLSWKRNQVPKIINHRINSISIDQKFLIFDEKHKKSMETGSGLFQISGGQINLIALKSHSAEKNPLIIKNLI